MKMKHILDYFPFDEPRPNQAVGLEWMAELPDIIRYILLEAPVGSGKSPMGICYSRYLDDGFGSSYILTPQRILQEQYERSFTDGTLASLYGKGNYTCHNKNTTCDIGSLVRPRCEGCPFTAALVKAKTAPNTVMNYKLGLLMFAYTPVFEYRQLMILDECHTLEQHLTEFNAVGINQKKAEKFGVHDWPEMKKTNIFEAKRWTRDSYYPFADAYLSRLHHEVEPLLERQHDDELTRAEIKKVREYDALQDHVDLINEFTLQPDDHLARDYVLVFDANSFKFKQLTGADNFHSMLKPKAKRFLFMSSTILNKEGFCKDLGLPPEETAFLSLDSEFPIDNRPVVFIPHMRMNATWNDAVRKDERKEMLNGIKKILSMHSDENGIIHTANFAIAKWLVDTLNAWPKATHQFIHHNPDSGDDRNAVIRQFMYDKTPSVLISPSITEGLDLVDDLGRFAIFAKVPFGYLGDQWIKRRLQMSKEWYQRRALIDIIQGGGRVVRSKDDWGTVYILDASWEYLYSQAHQQVPSWWKKAYRKL